MANSGAMNNGGELARLREEVAHLKARLEEEGLYYRGELEASRRRLEEQNTKLQAAEVVKRRRAEEHAAQLKGELHQARQEAEQHRQRCQQLEQRLVEQEQELRHQAAAEAEKVRAEIQESWDSAEEELHRMEQELARNRQTLAMETERRRQLEEQLANGAGGPSDADLRRLVDAQKKALQQVDAARRQAQAELAELKASGGRTAAPASGSSAPAGADTESRRPSLAGAQAVELSKDGEWAKLSFGEVDEGFTDEFLLMGADQSMGDVQRLEAALDPGGDTEDSRRRAALEDDADEPSVTVELPKRKPAVEAKPAPRSEQQATPRPEPVDRSRFQAPQPEPPTRRPWLRWVSGLVVLAAGGGAAAYALMAGLI